MEQTDLLNELRDDMNSDVNKILKKYQNREELEALCERTLIQDQTGIYIPPGQFKLHCQKKKYTCSSTVNPKRRKKNIDEVIKRFGQGKIGVSTDKFERRICGCCNETYDGVCLNQIPQPLDLSTTDHDLNQPGCSGIGNLKKSDSNNDVVSNRCSVIKNLRLKHDLNIPYSTSSTVTSNLSRIPFSITDRISLLPTDDKSTTIDYKRVASIKIPTLRNLSNDTIILDNSLNESVIFQDAINSLNVATEISSGIEMSNENITSNKTYDIGCLNETKTYGSLNETDLLNEARISNGNESSETRILHELKTSNENLSNQTITLNESMTLNEPVTSNEPTSNATMTSNGTMTSNATMISKATMISNATMTSNATMISNATITSNAIITPNENNESINKNSFGMYRILNSTPISDQLLESSPIKTEPFTSFGINQILNDDRSDIKTEYFTPPENDPVLPNVRSNQSTSYEPTNENHQSSDNRHFTDLLEFINKEMEGTFNIQGNVRAIENYLVDVPVEPEGSSDETVEVIENKESTSMSAVLRKILEEPETIDLTNTTPKPTRSIDTNEVIEIIDDGPKPNKLKPVIVEYINLDDSDDEAVSSANTSTANDSVIIIEKKNKKNEKKDDNRLECPVCLGSLKNKQIMSTICGHIFCTPCAQNVVKTTKACPNCRRKLTLKSIHPIYLSL